MNLQRPFQSLPLLLAALAPSPAARPSRNDGMVSSRRLGSDTISVESVTRRGNTVVIDGVDRFPPYTVGAGKSARAARDSRSDRGLRSHPPDR